MKLMFLTLIFILIFSLNVSSISFPEAKDSYKQGETIITKIQGNILSSINAEDIKLKRKNVQVPFEYGIKKLNNDYYLYAITPYSENNYTLIIENVKTTENGNQVEIDFEYNFTTSEFIAPYTLSPGIISTQSDFELNIFSNVDENQQIDLGFPEESSITLEPGDNTLYFQLEDFEQGLTFLKMGIYSVPVYVIKENNSIDTIEKFPLRVYPQKLDSKILRGSIQKYPIKIINVGDKELKNLVLNYNDKVIKIQPERIESLSPNEEITLNLTFSDYDKDINQEISFKSEDYEVKLPINITFTDSSSEVSTPYLEENLDEVSGFFCEELSGSVCSASEVCNGNIVSSIDQVSCCVGICVSLEDDSSYSWAGYALGGILLIILIFVFLKYKKSNKERETPSVLSRFMKKN